jgi:hypothetical protein
MSEPGARAADDAGAGRPVAEPEPDPEPAPVSVTGTTDDEHDDRDEHDEPNWWHRSHPTFAGVAGFFTGIVFVIAVPGLYATLLNAFLGEKTAERLFPYVLIALLIPIGLLFARKTRRFGQLMLVGMVATVLVVAVTAGIVLWVLISLDK